LNLKEINVYGFDYDYTLAQYEPNTIEDYIYEMAVKILVKDFRYPKKLLEYLKYDPNFIIRGLHYDIENELVFKLDSFCVIDSPSVYNGRKHIPWDQVKKIYKHRHVPVEKLETGWGNLATGGKIGKSLHYVSDRFAVPEMCLICDMIEFLRTHNESYDGRVVYEDVLKAVTKVHVSGVLFNEVTRNLDKYLKRGSLVKTLEYLKNNNKKVFMLTNSHFGPVNAGMKHLLDVRDWSEYFDLIILNAGKPKYFDDSTERIFKTTGPKWSSLESGQNPRPTYTPVRKFKPGFMYEGGCKKEMQRLTQWEDHEILFFGDHVYADLAGSSQNCSWRTAAIVPELESEIEICNSTNYRNNVKQMIELEEKLAFSQLILQDRTTSSEEVRNMMVNRSEIKEQMKVVFNQYFGSMFRCRIAESYFQRRLNRFAEIYTSDINNLCDVPLDAMFYPRRHSLAHEVGHM